MRFSRAFSIFVTVIVMVATAGAVQVDGYRAPGSFDARAYEQAQAELAAWLAQAEVAKGLESPITISLLPEEMAEIQGSPRQAAYKMLVGMTKPVNALVDFEMLEHGALRRAADGLVWSGAVHSEGAAALRVHLTDVDLPAGAELYIYNRNGEAFGPYTGRGPLGSGEFWSHTVTGDTALLQLRGAAPDSYFTIADVGHLGRDFRYAEYRQRGAATKAFCSFNEDCVVNAACVSSTAVNDARDAVAHYQFIQGAFIYMCSGGLIADSSQSGTPYFLTANHCVSRDRNAQSVETYFFFATIDCSDPCYTPASPHTIGASIVATNQDSDYTIMRLNGSAPGGAFFLGFEPDEVAFSDGDELYRISHPKGAPQAYSEHLVDTSKGTCSSWPRGPWIYSRDVLGATEGGSSGSPVVNSAGKVVGQLSGGCGTNVYEVCDADSNATVDGAFAAYYPEVQAILGGGGTSCDDLDSDGYDDDECGGNDCDDTDPAVNPGADEVCDDLIDNNCDGSVDEGCDACLPRGEPCSVNEECCSGSCHPRKGTCK